MDNRKLSYRNLGVLLKDHHYFGIEPQKLRAAAGRVVARVAGLAPERARVTSRQVFLDFGVDTVEGQSLVEELVAEGLLKPRADAPGAFGVATRFAKIAAARVVDPLPRGQARALVTEACDLAAQINATWTRIPLEIEAIAVYGSYMSRDAQLAELSFGVVVRARPATRRAVWRMETKPDGARAIRDAFRNLNPYVRARLATELPSLPRPFSVVFRTD
jgi:hypothetical protein